MRNRQAGLAKAAKFCRLQLPQGPQQSESLRLVWWCMIYVGWKTCAWLHVNACPWTRQFAALFLFRFADFCHLCLWLCLVLFLCFFSNVHLFVSFPSFFISFFALLPGFFAASSVEPAFAHPLFLWDPTCQPHKVLWWLHRVHGGGSPYLNFPGGGPVNGWWFFTLAGGRSSSPRNIWWIPSLRIFMLIPPCRNLFWRCHFFAANFVAQNLLVL